MRCTRLLRGLLLLTLLGMCPGCVVWWPAESSPLEGTWAVNADQENLTQMLLTFDRRGRLTKVTYQIGNLATVEETFTTGYGQVRGDTVSIQSTFAMNTLSFTGTFNQDRTRIDGRLTTEINLLAVRVTIDNGPATLTRVSAG